MITSTAGRQRSPLRRRPLTGKSKRKDQFRKRNDGGVGADPLSSLPSSKGKHLLIAVKRATKRGERIRCGGGGGGKHSRAVSEEGTAAALTNEERRREAERQR